MERRNFLSGLASLPLFRSIFRLVGGDKIFDGLRAHTHTTDREQDGLRGSVRKSVEETIYARVPGTPTLEKSLKTTEYDLDGRLLTTRISNPDGSEWVTTKHTTLMGAWLKPPLASRANLPLKASTPTMNEVGSRRLQTRMEKAT